MLGRIGVSDTNWRLVCALGYDRLGGSDEIANELAMRALSIRESKKDLSSNKLLLQPLRVLGELVNARWMYSVAVS